MNQPTTRKLKVYGRYRSGDKKAVPEIRLIGQWIGALGFAVVTPVQITVKGHSLIIEAVKQNGDEQ